MVKKIEVAVFDAKSYDKQFLEQAGKSKNIKWDFYDFRLNEKTALAAKGAEAVCVFVNDSADKRCLEQLSKLGVKHVALRSAGYNNIDLAAAKELNMSVTRVPAYSPHAVAEHAIGLLLALNRKIYRSYNRVRELDFSLHGLIGFDLCGKTAGIVGTGRIGKITAQILKGFEVNVLAYDPFEDKAWADKYGVKYADLPTLLRSCDIVSVHVPLLPETFYLFNEKTIRQMKKGAILINTSRGKVLETAALIQALKSGHLAGVALDTYEEEEGIFFEDLSDKILMDDELSRLLTFPNVLVTAHQGFFTQEALTEIAHITTSNILNLKEGKPFIPGTSLL